MLGSNGTAQLDNTVRTNERALPVALFRIVNLNADAVSCMGCSGVWLDGLAELSWPAQANQ